MTDIPREVLMSPGFRNVLRLARIPVDSSEPVRRKFGSRLIGIVTVCPVSYTHLDVYKRQPLGRVVSTSYDRVKQKVGRSGKPLNLRCVEVGLSLIHI